MLFIPVSFWSYWRGVIIFSQGGCLVCTKLQAWQWSKDKINWGGQILFHGSVRTSLNDLWNYSINIMLGRMTVSIDMLTHLPMKTSSSLTVTRLWLAVLMHLLLRCLRLWTKAEITAESKDFSLWQYKQPIISLRGGKMEAIHHHLFIY